MNDEPDTTLQPSTTLHEDYVEPRPDTVWDGVTDACEPVPGEYTEPVPVAVWAQ